MPLDHGREVLLRIWESQAAILARALLCVTDVHMECHEGARRPSPYAWASL